MPPRGGMHHVGLLECWQQKRTRATKATERAVRESCADSKGVHLDLEGAQLSLCSPPLAIGVFVRDHGGREGCEK